MILKALVQDSDQDPRLLLTLSAKGKRAVCPAIARDVREVESQAASAHASPSASAVRHFVMRDQQVGRSFKWRASSFGALPKDLTAKVTTSPRSAGLDCEIFHLGPRGRPSVCMRGGCRHVL